MLGRRGFLKAIGAGVLGLSLAIRRPDAPMSFEPEPHPGYRIGDTIHVRLPQRFVVRDGGALHAQPIVDHYVSVVITDAEMAARLQGLQF